MRKTTIILFLLFFNTFCYSQGWQWGRGSVGNNATAWPVATDLFGNIYCAAVSTDLISFDGYYPVISSAGQHCVLAKYTTSGEFLWSRYTENSLNSSIINIATDMSGNCYLLGWMQDPEIVAGSVVIPNTAYPNAQYFLIKYDKNGNAIWGRSASSSLGANTIPPVALNDTFSTKLLSFGALATDSVNNIYVTTCFNDVSVIIDSTTFINKGPATATNDILLIKYDSLGNIDWAKSWGGNGNDIPTGITITSSKSIYIVGLYNSDSIIFGASTIKDTGTATAKWNAFIVRCNTDGAPVWAAGSGGAGKVYAAGIASDGSNNVYVTGGMGEDSISFNGPLIINPYPGKPVLYLAKLDTLNNTNWYRAIGTPLSGGAYGYGVAASQNSRIVYVAGTFNDTLKIDTNKLSVPTGSIDPVFIACFDTFGHYISSGTLKSGADKQVGIATDKWGAGYLCADYKYPIDPFIIANDVLETVTPNESWLYLAKFVPPGYVGPGNGEVIVGTDTVYGKKDTIICLLDSASLVAPRGYSLYYWSTGSKDTILHVNAPGIYSVTCIGNGNPVMVYTFKIATEDGVCNCEAAIPNAFTPGRVLDNTFAPIFASDCAITKYAFSIYSRWGQRMFYTENPYEKWDGTFKGTPAETDVYMFYLKYTTNPKYPEHVKKGDLTLIR